jgi:hypothetical protein
MGMGSKHLEHHMPNLKDKTKQKEFHALTQRNFSNDAGSIFTQ